MNNTEEVKSNNGWLGLALLGTLFIPITLILVFLDEIVKYII